MSEPLDLADIQGIVARGYGGLPEASYLLLSINDAAEARPALRRLAALVTTAQQARPARAVNIALTAPGLLAVTGDTTVHPGFAEPFATGMTTAYRSRILGDVDGDAPQSWAWGGPGNHPVHVLVLLYAAHPAALAELIDETTAEVDQRALRVVARLDTQTLSEREHFGFKDGISQPLVEGLSGAATAVDRGSVVRAGEFVLGYVNEYGQRTYRPLLTPRDDIKRLLPRDADGSGSPDLGRNGTYLVFRQLEQDVDGFWAFLDRVTRTQDGTSDPERRMHLAAKLVGRWPSGAPLTLAPDADDASLTDANDFGYHALDENGLRCPIGAHIRRSNPRDSLEPRPGTERSREVNRRHRLLRRGRKYADASGKRGLHFLCVGANLARQFEFIQHSWVNDPSFNGMYDATDPLIGPRHGGGATFVEPVTPIRRRIRDLPQFVHVRGGAYFFLPGISALRYLLREKEPIDRSSARRDIADV